MTETLVPETPVSAAEPAASAPSPVAIDWRGPAMSRRLRARYRAERRFRRLALGATLGAAGFLLILLATMLGHGVNGFRETRLLLPIDWHAVGFHVDPAALRGPGAERALADAGLDRALATAGTAAFGPGGDTLIAPDAWLAVGTQLARAPGLLTRPVTLAVPAASDLDQAAKGGGTPAMRAHAARLRGQLEMRWSRRFLFGADATDPTAAGIGAALMGSLLTLAVTLALAVPVGIGAALWLEEFAPRHGWTDLVEVSITNLAAVPSIIFGLLGLAVLIGTLGLPRSAPLVGGVTLALMTMPVIVIAARNALAGVPLAIRDGARALGASRVQVVFHHVLPLAWPGVLTGTVIGIARALGETAPLLLLGMRAFIPAAPHGINDPATALPVQIFLWAGQAGNGFAEKTSAAILALLALLLAVNAGAVWLRARLEVRR